jgi:hypothetical protein
LRLLNSPKAAAASNSAGNFQGASGGASRSNAAASSVTTDALAWCRRTTLKAAR